jgi:hypothetical protein
VVIKNTSMEIENLFKKVFKKYTQVFLAMEDNKFVIEFVNRKITRPNAEVRHHEEGHDLVQLLTKIINTTYVD